MWAGALRNRPERLIRLCGSERLSESKWDGTCVRPLMTNPNEEYLDARYTWTHADEEVARWDNGRRTGIGQEPLTVPETSRIKEIVAQLMVKRPPS